MKYVLGGETYTSKAAIEVRCRAILGPHPRREYTLEGADLEFTRSLFERHPDAREKSDVAGTKSFRVVASSMGTHCLAVARADGTWERWSYGADTATTAHPRERPCAATASATGTSSG